MRYRFTVISIVAVALVAAAIVFSLNRGNEPRSERSQNELFPGGLGVVGAFTATARAGGGATIDPTALVTPSTTVHAIPTSTAVTGSTPTSAAPTLRLSSEQVAPGGLISVDVSGAAPGESFELAMSELPVGSGTTDSSGSSTVEVVAPRDLSPQTVDLTFTGAESGQGAISITISVNAPLVKAEPSASGSSGSVLVSADNFVPGEAITISVSGQTVASGIADGDGGFSVTTGLPESLLGSGANQTISADGSDGSIAMAPIDLSREALTQPTSTALSGDLGEGSGPPGQESLEPAPEPESEQRDDAGGTSLSNLPAWIYFAAGTVVGWLALLTVWVIRIDRSRDRWIAALEKETRKAGGQPSSRRIIDTADEGRDRDSSHPAA